MKILVVDEELPYPLDSGKRIRSYSIYSRLAERHDVHYVGFNRGRNSAAESALTDCGITPHCTSARLPGKSGIGFYWRLAVSLLDRLPYSVRNHYHAEYGALLSSLAAQHEYDVVCFEWTPYLQYSKPALARAAIASTHNMEQHIWQRMAATESNFFRRAYIQLQARRWCAFEGRAFDHVNGAVVVSESDARAISRLRPGLPVAVVENGVDTRYYNSIGAMPEQLNVVFIGSMDWRPNHDGIVFFVQEILPLLRKELGNVAFSVVGKNPSNSLRELAAKCEFTVTGRVPDVRPFLESASVVVVPLRVGGGSRLKILEALAAGRPVVSTTIGAEGLRVEHDRNILIADRPREFVRSIAQVARDEAFRLRLVRAGRELIELGYDWEVVAKRFEEFIMRVVERSERTA